MLNENTSCPFTASLLNYSHKRFVIYICISNVLISSSGVIILVYVVSSIGIFFFYCVKQMISLTLSLIPGNKIKAGYYSV